MKQFRRIIICLVLIAAMLVPSFAFADEEQVQVLGTVKVEEPAQCETPKLSFTVVGDFHLDELLFQTLDSNYSQFKKILNDALESGHDDIFISGGDMSSYGNTLVWYLAKEMVGSKDFDRTIWTLGNHEYGILGTHLFTRCKFKTFANKDSIYFTEEVNGYKFICLGVEEGIPGTLGSYSKKQLAWFKDELISACAENKPVFVISHYGEISGNMGTELGKIVNEVKPTAPVIFMWGHEHGLEYLGYGYDDLFHEYKDEAGQNKYTTARMGATHYYWSDKSDALYVDVYENKVVLDLHRVTGKELEKMPLVIEY